MASFRFSHAVAALLALVCIALGSLSPARAAGVGAIVFQRMQQNADGSLRSSNLWLLSPGGIRELTPAVDGERDAAGSWSPSGTRIAFEHAAASDNPTAGEPSARSDIRMVDAANRRIHQLTPDTGSFRNPVWGPGERLAFVSSDHRRNCLSVVQPNDRRQLRLFCLPIPAEMARPVWSSDGRSLYLHAGYYTGDLEPHWRSLAYRIDAATGAPFVLRDEVLAESRSLEFAPDGRRGIYSDVYTNDLVMVDFARGQERVIGTGYAPRWSRDGTRIAFTREVYEVENPSDVRYYEALFVMSADGTHVRRLTNSRLNNHADTAVEWSADDSRLLANRRIYVDPSLTVARYAMRIIDTRTGAITVLTDGYADPGAWRAQ